VHPLFGVPLAFAFMWLLGGGLYGTALNRAASNLTAVGFNIPMSFLPAGVARVLQGALGFIVFGGVLFVLSYLLVLLLPLFVDSLAIDDQAIFALGVALIVATIVMGGIYGLIIKKVITRDLFTSLLATFGLAIFLQQMLNILFGPETQTADAGFESWFLFDGAVTLPLVKVIGFGMAAALAAGIIVFMKYSRMGQAIRATSQDARAARVLGIDTEKVYAFTFSLNAAICGASGALIAMIWVIQPFFGIVYSIRCFVIVTAAGLGNLPGVIATGLGMGVIEQYGGFVLGAEYQQAIIVLMLLAVLIVRQLQQRRIRQVVQ